MASSGTLPELERIFVAADGSVKALYRDNSLLLLSSNAASFTRVSADGAKTVQLTECCLSRWKQVLAELLAFRNQHLDVPCVPPWLQKQLQEQHGLLFSTGYPVTDTTWPPTAEDAVEAGLVKLLDAATIQLFSTCGSAYITLQHTGLRFAVCYPLLLSCDAASNTYTFMQHTQVFSRSQHPARWQQPLAVAAAAAALAAQSSAQPVQQQQQHGVGPQDLLLLDVTNKLSIRSASPNPARHSCSTAGVDHAAAHAGSSSAGSPTQLQHRPWPGRSSAQGAGTLQHHVFGTPSAASPKRQWHPPGSPGSPSAALYAAAEQQQRQLDEPSLCASPAAHAAQHCSSLDLVVQLPLMPAVEQSLPAHRQQQRQVLPLSAPFGQAGSSSRTGRPGSSSSSEWPSPTAAALAEALGQRQQGGSSSTEVGMGSWWLEPHLLLPKDQLLQMVWSPDATLILLEDMGEVEAWLHADDSFLFSFQAGAFVKHLQPCAAAAAAPAAACSQDHAAAGGTGLDADAVQSMTPAAVSGAGALSRWTPAEPSGGQGGLVEGCDDDGCSVSRVYAAATLPADLCVPVLLPDGSRCRDVMLPLGRVATEALRFRSTMVRVKALLSTSSAAAAAAPPAQPSRSKLGLLQQQAHLQQGHHHQKQQQGHLQQQQQALSLEVAEDQEVPGVGHFTAYADGRVRVLFSDRTILSLDAGRSWARLILPDGSRQEVPASRPLGVEEYVQAALEFATWSSHTPIERAVALRMQALVAAELRSSARMAAICEWGSNPQRLPEAAACLQEPAAAPLLLTAHGSPEKSLCAVAGPPAGRLGDAAGVVGDAVESLLAANRSLIDRL